MSGLTPTPAETSDLDAVELVPVPVSQSPPPSRQVSQEALGTLSVCAADGVGDASEQGVLDSPVDEGSPQHSDVKPQNQIPQASPKARPRRGCARKRKLLGSLRRDEASDSDTDPLGSLEPSHHGSSKFRAQPAGNREESSDEDRDYSPQRRRRRITTSLSTRRSPGRKGETPDSPASQSTSTETAATITLPEGWQPINVSVAHMKGSNTFRIQFGVSANIQRQHATDPQIPQMPQKRRSLTPYTAEENNTVGHMYCIQKRRGGPHIRNFSLGFVHGFLLWGGSQ
ncbi:hypothetical protein B0I35DRAFT_414509 [Stachybotrys elegans]|uniref:Uncharacterized protein n=1 Tax=Stachybotrys elegans TaxID=80388 RepID=A0A8K0SI75_9HYPO|nr:hypothetical protein B0I35DRAFT_414509 [Stachybotrys elegans]